jgi:hypothetical protein
MRLEGNPDGKITAAASAIVSVPDASWRSSSFLTAITGHDRPGRTRHLAATILGAHDPRRPRLHEADLAAHLNHIHFNP